ncbi:MAG TPA: hypothetical protein VHZ54_01100 [Solirubrobacterales bacterium]|nr:hypothetical protein [Solirubrobacterales bacterium]
MRIRWRGVARVAAIVAVGLIALSFVPSLLRGPEPPPLGRDVGLPSAKPAASRSVHVMHEPSPRRRGKPRHRKKSRVHHRAVPDAPAAAARIGTRTHRRREHRSAPPKSSPDLTEPAPEPVEPAPPAAPEYVPPAAPEPAPTPVPEPPSEPRSVPGDGSQEFAPH